MLRIADAAQPFIANINFTEATLVKVHCSCRAHLAVANHHAALPRDLLRHRTQSFARHHGALPHPALGAGWQLEAEHTPRPHRGALQHEDRKRPAKRSPRQHHQIEGNGRVPGPKTRNGTACARTADKDTDRDGQAVEQGESWWRSSRPVGGSGDSVRYCMISIYDLPVPRMLHLLCNMTVVHGQVATIPWLQLRLNWTGKSISRFTIKRCRQG